MDGVDHTKARVPLAGLLLGGALFLMGGGLHPRPADGIDEVELAIADMAAADAWYVSHVLTGLAYLVIGVSLFVLIRNAWPEDSRLRTLGWVAVAGCALGVADAIPHTLLETEIDELVAGGSTPLADVHLVVQAFTTPIFGVGVAILGVVGARERLVGHWFTAALAVIGGLAYSLAGPGVALGGTGASALFAAGFFIGWFAVISGAIGLLRVRRHRQLNAAPLAI